MHAPLRHLKLWLFGFLAFWLFSSALAAPDSTAHKPPVGKAAPAPQWALDRFKLCWDALKEDSLPERVYQICWRDLRHTGNIAPFKDTLQEWALQGITPGGPPLLRFHSAELLALFRNDTTQQALRSLIAHNDTLQVFAAQTLITWGDWENAAPVLEARGLYNDLAADQRALPVLYRALRSPDLSRRLLAASALYGKLQRPDSLHDAARQILALPSSERSVSVTKQAVDLIARNPGAPDLLALTHLVNTDTSRWARLGAFGAVVTAAFTGDSTALTQLDIISQTCPDAQIRERAHGYVNTVRKGARGGTVPNATDTTNTRQP
ncbi:MAG TPA: hypothetical protein VGL38_00770 [bacterium]|jgi:hypothetical protein